MDAKDSKQSGGGAILASILLLVVVLLPALYVASLGPAVWLLDHHLVSPQPVLVIYWPLEMLAQESPAARDVLTWYADFFRERQLAQ
jgi:hypothetical protein